MKRLVVCCDGTWNKPDQYDRGVLRPTNVVKMARLVLPQAVDGTVQHAYYDQGVGTGDLVDKAFGGAFGVGLARNVIAAYDFLSQNHEAGDQIWLFGFSRGAYTARRVVGMVRKCGLLPKTYSGDERKHKLQDAYDLYTRRENAEQGGADSDAATAFRQANASPRVPIEFIGVWDTVGAYGIAGVVGQLTTVMSSARFHDSRLSSDVKYACHAIAIDEQRRLFQPTLWEQGPAGAANGQVIEQRWFAGVHSNVGGGYQDTGLSDIALWWMAARAESRGLDLDNVWRARLAPSIFGELRDSRTGIYKLMGHAWRGIGVQPRGFEGLHHSAFDRSQRDPQPYHPDNMTAYLAQPGRLIDLAEPQ